MVGSTAREQVVEAEVPRLLKRQTDEKIINKESEK